MFSKKNFFLGAGSGVALTLVTLQLLGDYLETNIVALAQPQLLQPFSSFRLRVAPGSPGYRGLPSPWLPSRTNTAQNQWSIRPLEGAPITLGELKSKVVFVTFWLTTCPPCIAEMPSIEALSKSLEKGSGFVPCCYTRR